MTLCIKFDLRLFPDPPELLNIVYGKLYIWTKINALKGLKIAFSDFGIKMGMFICNLELFCKEEERKGVLEFFYFIKKTTGDRIILLYSV